MAYNGAGLSDDATLLLIEYHGRPPSNLDGASRSLFELVYGWGSRPELRREPFGEGRRHRAQAVTAERPALGSKLVRVGCSPAVRAGGHRQPAAAGRQHPQDVAGLAAACTCRAGARPRDSSPPGSNQFSPTAPGPPPARPHGWRDPPLGDQRHGHVLEHLQVALDALAARASPRRRSPGAAGSAAPASGTPAPAPRSACSCVLVIAVCTPLMPGAARRRPPCPPAIVS